LPGESSKDIYDQQLTADGVSPDVPRTSALPPGLALSPDDRVLSIRRWRATTFTVEARDANVPRRA
jgi:hypothetical protein